MERARRRSTEPLAASSASRRHDSPKQRWTKRMLVPCYAAFGAAALAVYSVATLGYGQAAVGSVGMLGLLLVATACLLVGLLPSVASSRTPTAVATATIVVLTAGVALCDWWAAAEMRDRRWQWGMLLVDVALLTDAGARVQHGLVAVLLSWLLLVELEEGLRFGLLEAAVWDGGGGRLQACDCAEPPCAVPGALSATSYAEAAVLIVGNFYMMRGFADGVRKHYGSVEVSISVAQQVAEELSAYRIDQARSVVAGEAGRELPQGLCTAFLQLLSNLETYRAYLPQSCLPREISEDGTEEKPAESSDDDDDDRGDPGGGPSLLEVSCNQWIHGTPKTDGESILDVTELSSTGAKSMAQYTQSEASPVRECLPNHRVSKKRHGSTDSSWDDLRTGPCGAQVAAVHVRRVSLIAANRQDFLGTVFSSDVQVVDSWMAHDITAFASTVAAQKGCVDLISGDRRFASFGASRYVVSHRQAAVRCAWKLLRLTAESTASSVATATTKTSASSVPVEASRIYPWRPISELRPSVQGSVTERPLETSASVTSSENFILAPPKVSVPVVRSPVGVSQQMPNSPVRMSTHSVDVSGASLGFGVAELLAVGSVQPTPQPSMTTIPVPSVSRSLMQLPVTMAVCTGRCLTGDFGGSLMRRFMCVGGVCNRLLITDRIAAFSSCPILCDDLVRREVDLTLDCRLHARVLFPPKCGLPEPELLWEVCGDRMETVSRGNVEWMYELGRAAPPRWEGYNRLLRQILRATETGGQSPTAAVTEDHVSALLSTTDKPDVRAKLEELRARITAGDRPTTIVAGELRLAPAEGVLKRSESASSGPSWRGERRRASHRGGCWVSQSRVSGPRLQVQDGSPRAGPPSPLEMIRVVRSHLVDTAATPSVDPASPHLSS